MNNGFNLPRTLILVIASILLAGCARSPQTRFYTLSPLVQQEAQPSTAAKAPLSVSIMPVEIPDYLNRPQIVTRSGQNELKLAEFDRWGGSLADNIAAVMVENLSQLLASDRVQAVPRGRNENADYTLAMRVLRLDCFPGEQLILKVQWGISSTAQAREAVTRVATYSEKLKDRRYDTVAAALSGTLERLSREIAREISVWPTR